MSRIIRPEMVGDKVRLDSPAPGIVCVACGCDEDHACITPRGPCAWAAVHEELGIGLCSACAARPIAELEMAMFSEASA